VKISHRSGQFIGPASCTMWIEAFNRTYGSVFPEFFKPDCKKVIHVSCGIQGKWCIICGGLSVHEQFHTLCLQMPMKITFIECEKLLI
jgi:hypothetical protein